MKRLSKLIAVLAALVMVMAMSSSVFATNYSAGELYNGGEAVGNTPAWDDAWIEDFELDPNDPEAMKLLDSEKIKDILDDKFEIPEGAEIIPIYGADVQYGSWYIPGANDWTELELKDSVTVDFVLWDDSLKAGDKVYLLHYNETTKVWEVYEKTVQSRTTAAGEVQLYVSQDFTSLSPVGVVKVMKNGEVIALKEKTSPQTGL